MKKLFLVIFTGILLGASCVPWPLAQETSGPNLVLKERVYDFGEIFEGKDIEHIFKVFNQGDKPLEIKGVKPG